MEEIRTIIMKIVSEGLSVSKATKIAGINKSTYYYKPNGRKKGKPATTFTHTLGGGIVPNSTVLDTINSLISPDYNDYGYHTVAELLKRMGYVINHKKVYRLMGEANLLYPPIKKGKNINKKYIEYTVPPLIEPCKTIEADIKYVHIHGEKRNAYLLNFICTFCRHYIAWSLDYSMKADKVIGLLDEIKDNPLIWNRIKDRKTKFLLRTDNGSQFIAKVIAKKLDDLKINHEFIHLATPQENGHIESFHNTFTKLVCNRHYFQNIEHARKIIKDFAFQYNNVRVMKSILYYCPLDFVKIWDAGYVGIKKNKENKEIFYFREKPTSMLKVGIPHEVSFANNKFNTFVT